MRLLYMRLLYMRLLCPCYALAMRRAIFNYNGVLFVESCVFRMNSADTAGGALLPLH